MNREKAQRRFIFICLAPAVILATIFIFIPTINVFRMSLYRMGGITNKKSFVGFSNFVKLMDDKNFLEAMQNSILIIVMVMICTIVLAVLFAALLSRGNFKGKNFFRIIFYIPNILSIAAIPEDLYEAASLDGATEIQIFFQVTLPLIWSNIRTTLTFYIISTINLSFLFVQIMTDGGPNGKTEVFLNYMYKQAYGAGVYGYGMAIGVVVFLFSFILAAVVNKITDREVLEF